MLGLAKLENLDEIAAWDMRRIERLSGFNANGDLTSHLGVTIPDHTLTEEDDLPPFVLAPGALALLENFAAEMSARGVRVVMSYSPAERSFYEAHQAAIDGWDAIFRANPAFAAPSPPSQYVFDASMHFDTVYHLNEQGALFARRCLPTISTGV